MNKIFLTLFILLGAIAFGATKAEAATFLLAQGSDGGALYATVSTTKYDHVPGEEVQATVCVDNQSTKINLGNTTGGTNGTWKTFLNGAPCRTAAAGHAPNTPGTYAVNFETNFTRTNPACSDGVDNDGDGLIDYPNDPGCYGPQDEDEYNAIASGQIDFELILGRVSDSWCSGSGGTCVEALVRSSLGTPLEKNTSFTVVYHDSAGSVYWGPTITAGQTQGSSTTRFYGTSGATNDNNVLIGTSISNERTVAELRAGTLLTAYDNVKLKLNHVENQGDW